MDYQVSVNTGVLVAIIYNTRTESRKRNNIESMQLEIKWRKMNSYNQIKGKQKEEHNTFSTFKRKKLKNPTRNINIMASDDKTYSTICYVHLARMLYIRFPIKLLSLFPSVQDVTFFIENTNLTFQFTYKYTKTIILSKRLKI